MMAVPAQWIFGESISDPSSFGVAIYVLLPVIVISVHLLVWGLAGHRECHHKWCDVRRPSRVFGVVMSSSPTVGDRCPECGIALSEAEVSRAKSRRIYQPMASAGSATNDLENPTSNA